MMRFVVKTLKIVAIGSTGAAVGGVVGIVGTLGALGLDDDIKSVIVDKMARRITKYVYDEDNTRPRTVDYTRGVDPRFRSSDQN
jgi:hypothetical protein